MRETGTKYRLRHITNMAAVLLIGVLAAYVWFGIRDVKLARASAIAGIVLVLWLSELIPLYATTFVLASAMVIGLGPLDPQAFAVNRVLSVAASPIIALFFGGFVLSVAGTKYGIDRYIAHWLIWISHGRRRLLLLAIMSGTAVLSMWMSNIAAAAMMVATLKPLFDQEPEREAGSFRTALLLGVAFSADFGGMGTPIGTGPNLIAIGALANHKTITFAQWMKFGVPASTVMVLVTFGLLVMLYGVKGKSQTKIVPSHALSASGWSVVAIFILAVGGWIFEPMLGVPAAVVALIVAAALFGSGLLTRSDLACIEWDTLLLVAGGITFGHLVEASGLASRLASGVNWHSVPPAVTLFAMLFACATLSAVASNTAAAAMIIPVAMTIIPSPSVAILVALGASMGVPFVISTPPNSLVYGKGGLYARDLFWPGIILMVFGCGSLVLIGPAAIKLLGLS